MYLYFTTLKQLVRDLLLSTLIAILSVCLLLYPSFALISLEEEEKIGREVLQELSKEIEFVNDIEIVAYVNALSGLLIKKGISFSPFNFRFYVIKDKTFNAFSVPGGYIFFKYWPFLDMQRVKMS